MRKLIYAAALVVSLAAVFVALSSVESLAAGAGEFNETLLEGAVDAVLDGESSEQRGAEEVRVVDVVFVERGIGEAKGVVVETLAIKVV